jgi:hypothetical protein
VADVDLDGDLDLAVGKSNQDRVYFNLTRQVFAPGLARIGLSYHVELHARDATGSVQQVFYPLLSPRSGDIFVPPYGHLGLDYRAINILPVQLISPATTMSTLVLPVPQDPALAGAKCYLQGLVVHSPSGLVRFTNVETDTVLKL